MNNKCIPVIDLFAGPGGLGEGFAAYARSRNEAGFKIKLSIEKDRHAHETLVLRSFFRQFSKDNIPSEYYEFLRRVDLPIAKRRQELFNRFPEEAEKAKTEAWCAELGREDPRIVNQRIASVLEDTQAWVLLGGPPCQAYSVVGRSRNKGNPNYMAEKDERQYLYIEYLQILADHEPTIFIMENVKGLLSATLNNQRIFDRILEDLKEPSLALKREGRNISPHQGAKGNSGYRIFSLVQRGPDLRECVVEMERHGIPQSRHRLILIGVRADLGNIKPSLLPRRENIPAKRVLVGLPRIRSGLTRETDSGKAWKDRLSESLGRRWFRASRKKAGEKAYNFLKNTVQNISLPRCDRGGEFIPFNPRIGYREDWFIDTRLAGVCNHTSRAHMHKDIHRYLYAACFAKAHNLTPMMKDFPADLLPQHKNIKKALSGNNFTDRFRVQVASRAATTITSHISKDGHYYIHPDPTQCRSLTVREAARLQTFPDNYFFCGPRTQQYIQVGNAVPPLLATDIADIVYDLLKKTGTI